MPACEFYVHLQLFNASPKSVSFLNMHKWQAFMEFSYNISKLPLFQGMAFISHTGLCWKHFLFLVQKPPKALMTCLVI